METLYVCDVTEEQKNAIRYLQERMDTHVLLTINVFLDNVLLLCIALDPVLEAVKYRN